jgi:3',5'-cyclic AMP phosphodiesterase CpdA
MNHHPSRREALKFIAGATAASLLDLPSVKASPSDSPQRFRFVHLTDIHVQRERDAHQGFAAALKAVESLKPRPDFIMTGGDLVFDVLEASPARARELFTLYKKVIADHTSLPVHNTIGNHDVFGWANKEGVTPRTPGYGREMVKEFLEMEETYHTFRHKGWQFFCLDNIQPADDGLYQGYLEDRQRSWFVAEMNKLDAKTPIVVCEHIPLITVTLFDHKEMNKGSGWRIGNNALCRDTADRLTILGSKHVRLCLSGHIHERDRIEYRGMTFINDGAVCGNWWKGIYRGVKEGFGVYDLRADGSFDYQYHEYGWKA